mgnify:CR=1 FL=1
MTEPASQPPKVATGIPGLDSILRGGFLKEMVYLVHGGPGTGKTTLGMQFLLEGVRQGEPVFYASLLQTRRELEAIMGSHGWSLDGISLLDMPEGVSQSAAEEQTVFAPADIELHELTDRIIEAVARLKPRRMVFDSITELAVLVEHPSHLRRQMLKLKHELASLGCTALFTINDTEAIDLASIQTVVHGVLELGIDRPDYAPPRRWLEVTKTRGMVYFGGRHNLQIRTGGLEVYPRLEPTNDRAPLQWRTVSSGNEALDALFGGGLEEGSACLVTGTTGAGKSTLASLYVQAAARRGEKAIVFCFDERRQTYLRRSEALGLEIGRQVEQGLVDLRQVNVGELSPGEFANRIRCAVEQWDAKIVVIDSINGYFHAMPDQSKLLVQLHEILSYLGESGVLTLMVTALHGLASVHTSDVDASYIADTVVLMRSFEARGSVRRCISVLKKRHGPHEKTIREVMLEQGGMRVGEPLTDFQGVLSGNPVFDGDSEQLLNGNRDEPDA